MRSGTGATGHEAYLRGRWHWSRSAANQEELAKALVCFMEAIADDPKYARAHAGVADYYLRLGLWGGLPPAESLRRHSSLPRPPFSSIRALVKRTPRSPLRSGRIAATMRRPNSISTWRSSAIPITPAPITGLACSILRAIARSSPSRTSSALAKSTPTLR